MKKRIFYLIGGVILMLFAGVLYSWSVFEQGILREFPEWESQLSLTFTFTMACFVLGGVVGGILRKRIAGRWIARIGAVLALIGFICTSRAQSVVVLYLCYGVLCGFGIGFAYNATMNTITHWFPEKTGIAAGLLLAGFGVGSMIINKVGASMIIDMGWRNMLLILGIIIGCVMLVCSFLLAPVGADVQLPKPKSRGEKHIEFSTKETLQKSAYWIHFIWATILSIGGLIVLSYAVRIVGDVSLLTGDELLQIGSTYAGIISVFNGLSRIVLGLIFDRFGQKKAVLTANIICLAGLILVLVALWTHSLIPLAVGFACIGSTYGGIGTINTSILKNMYGEESYAMNLGIFNIHVIIGSVLGPVIAGSLYEATSSYDLLFICLVIASVIAVVLGQLIRFSKKDRKLIEEKTMQA